MTFLCKTIFVFRKQMGSIISYLLLFVLFLGINPKINAQFSEIIIISDTIKGATSVYTSDLDGDGDLDVLAAARANDHTWWFRNDGTANFDTAIVISDKTNYARCVRSADLDNDGDQDVLVASRDDHKISWFENDGKGNFGERKVITTKAKFALSVRAADLDNDGDLDILSASRGNDRIAWYENDGTGSFGEQIIISNNADYARCVHYGDLDNDGDIDVLSASREDHKIAWYENDGTAHFSEEKIISLNAKNAYTVNVADLDKDGDLDVLSASNGDNKVAWYKNDGFANFSDEITISTDVGVATFVIAEDFDLDGDLDIAACGTKYDEVIWFENTGNTEFGEKQIISNTADQCKAIYVSDLDMDGDMDVLSASALDHKIAWYENHKLCPSPLSMEVYIENATCKEANGKAWLEIGNNTGKIDYNWSHNDTLQQVMAEQLAPGIYMVSINDTTGCSLTTTFSIEDQTNPPVFMVESQNTSCGNTDGLASIIQTEGDEIISYLWSTGDTSAYVENLAGGEYGITITDINNCSPNQSFIIKELSIPDLDLGMDTLFLKPDEELSIQAPVQEDLSYFWNTGDTTANIIVSEPGIYSLTVVNIDGCTNSDTAVVLIWSAIKAMNKTDLTVTLSPNPSLSIINIEVLPKSVYQLFICDNKGSIVHSELSYFSQNILNLQSFQTGIYFVRLIAQDGHEKTIKLIKLE